jgi:hypothetical protein
MYALILNLMLSSTPMLDIVLGYGVDIRPSAVSAMQGVTVIEETRLAEGVRPRYHHVAYLVKRRVDFGVFLDIRFEFFNEKLMQIDLYPVSPEDMRRLQVGVCGRYGLKIDEIGEGKSAGGVRVFINENAWGNKSISISVDDVLEEFDDWIDHYS